MSGRRTSRRDRGVALVETAIILPLVVLVLIGMIEAGFAWRDNNTLARATQQAARTAARMADSGLADYEALRALDASLGGLSASSIEKVIIFDASSGTGSTPPPSCLTLVPSPSGNGNASCNVYSPEQVRSDNPAAFGADGTCSGWDQYFCPDRRERTGATPDRIGVWVELDFEQVTSVLPMSLSITDGSVYQLEPCIAGASTC